MPQSFGCFHSNEREESVAHPGRIKRPPAVVYEEHTLREAADLMVGEEIGRLPVVTRARPSNVVAMLTRSDLLPAHRKRLDEAHRIQQSIRWRKERPRSRRSASLEAEYGLGQAFRNF